MKQRLGAHLAALALAALLGFEGMGALTRRAPAAAAPRPEPVLAGHQRSDLEIVLDSQGAIDLLRGDASLHVRLVNRHRGATVARYAVELVDDLGNEIERPYESERLRIAKGGSAPIAVELPSRLGEGFILCRITAAGVSGDADSDHLLEVGLVVENGTARILTSEEWLSLSRANQGA